MMTLSQKRYSIKRVLSLLEVKFLKQIDIYLTAIAATDVQTIRAIAFELLISNLPHQKYRLVISKKEKIKDHTYYSSSGGIFLHKWNSFLSISYLHIWEISSMPKSNSSHFPTYAKKIVELRFLAQYLLKRLSSCCTFSGKVFSEPF